MFTTQKTKEEISAMRASGKILAQVIQSIKRQAASGMTTKDLAQIAQSELKKLGGEPVFLGYHGFPDVLCTSVNDEVVHGIPSDNRRLKNGDVLSLDFGVKYKGMITDAATTLSIGQATDSEKILINATKQALDAGIKVIKDGVKVGEISYAIQQELEKYNLGIVRDFVGHGVGHNLHEEPNIPNYGPSTSGPVLRAGMTIAVEPMATLGSDEVIIGDDGWTVSTRDKSKAAHFEHTILVTKNGSEILTK